MGRQPSDLQWLERDYDALFAAGETIVDPLAAVVGLKVVTYAPDLVDQPGPLFSIKRDGFGDEPLWPDAAWWPAPHRHNDLDLMGES